MQQTSPDELVRISRIMQWFCLGVAAIILLGAGYAVVRVLADPAALAGFFDGANLNADRITATQAALTALVNAPTIALIAYALLALWMLFGAFRKGDLVSPRAANLMRRAGVAFALAAIWSVIAHTLSVLLLTLNNPVGERQLAIGLSSDQLFPLLLAGVLFAIGHVLSVAAAIEAENRAFV